MGIIKECHEEVTLKINAIVINSDVNGVYIYIICEETN